MRRRRSTVQRVGLILLAVVLVAALVLPLAGSVFGATTDDGLDDDAASAAGPVVLLGTGGLRWEDLSALATPSLWTLAEGAGVANVVVRSVRSSTCPADGWLAVSAGRRAADLPAAEQGVCRLLEDAAGGAVPGWSDYLDAAADASYDARPGTFGELLADAARSGLALGPGAAIALADAEGAVVGQYLPRPEEPEQLGAAVQEHAPGNDVVVVDLGAVRDRDSPLLPADDPRFTGPEEEAAAQHADWPLGGLDRTEQVAQLEARAAAVLAALPGDATVLLTSLADSGTAPMMQVLALSSAAEPAGMLESRSTRQPGMVQATDVLPTLLDHLDIDAPAGLAGAPITTGATAGSGASRIATLIDENRHAVAVRPLTAPFFSGLILINLGLYALVTVGLNRRFLDRSARWVAARRSSGWAGLARSARAVDPDAALRTLRAVAVAVAAIPLASYLANLLPWWRAASPGLVVYTATVAVAALIAGLALARPWRHQLLTPVGVVAGLTALVLVIDVLTGARLQLAALMGVQPQVGGRFYGINNSSFALWAASTLLAASCLAEPLVRRGRRRAAALVVAGIGVLATVLNGAPEIGADFGGPPALLPAFTILTLLTLGIRLTWKRVALVLAAAAAVAISFSIIDWLRPPAERSHLGRFVETVLDGGLLSVIQRNLGQNLSNLFGSTLTFLAVGGIALVVLVLTQPLRRAARAGDHAAYGWLATGSTLRRLDADACMLRPALVSVAVALGIGFAVNDSGIVIPAIGISLAVPLLIGVLAGWLLRLRAEHPAPQPAGSAR